jgi:hypothetical protein
MNVSSRAGLDWFPTLLAAAGDTMTFERLLKSTQLGQKNFKPHLDELQHPAASGRQGRALAGKGV